MSQSTRLENFHWTPEGARFEADGRDVQLRAEDHASALSAAQAFYQEAWSAYPRGAVVAPAPAGILPDWVRPSQWAQKIRSLFARVLSHATGQPYPAAAPAPDPGGRPAAAPGAKPMPAAEAKPPSPPARTAPNRETSREDGPRLRAAFADAAGVHVVWADPGAGGQPRETELLYAFDSAVAAKLQACYRGLAELGYDVVDLRVWRKDAETAKGGPAPKERAEENPKPEPAKPDTSRVMRFHPEPGDTPGRAVVSPVEDEKNLQVLTAPERLVAALHAAADPKRPAAERVTHVRCAARRGALKVVAVGIGGSRDDASTPDHWENIATWWEQAKKTLRPQVAPAAPNPAAKSGPQPELF